MFLFFNIFFSKGPAPACEWEAGSLRRHEKKLGKKILTGASLASVFKRRRVPCSREKSFLLGTEYGLRGTGGEATSFEAFILLQIVQLYKWLCRVVLPSELDGGELSSKGYKWPPL